MVSEIIKKENSVVTLKMRINADSFDKACQNAYQKSRSKFNIPGFRKGKAPKAIIEKQYGEGVFFEDAINALFPDAFEAAVKEHNIEAIDRPEIDVEEIGKGQDLVIIADVAVKPDVELGQYKNIEVEEVSSEVSEDEIEGELKRMQEQNARFISVEDREVKSGDMLLIDFNGKVDGEEFEGGKSENYSIVVGSNTFIPGFEEQLEGMKLNEEKDLSVKFPDEYHSEDLAGKDAVFTVKINEIKEKELPALDDEFVKDVSEFDTLDELKKDIREKMEKSKSAMAENETKNKIIEKVAENSKVEIPEVMIEKQIENMLYDFDHQLRNQGLDLENYLKLTGTEMDDLKGQMKPDAEKRVKNGLVIDAVAKAENIEVSDEEMEKELKDMADSYKMEVEKIKSTLRESDLEYIKDTVVARKTVEFMKENAKLQ